MSYKDENSSETEKERKINALLNLEAIKIYSIDSFSSSTCSGYCSFSIECNGRGGYAEDPDFENVVFEVMDTKREGDGVILKLKAKIQQEE